MTLQYGSSSLSSDLFRRRRPRIRSDLVAAGAWRNLVYGLAILVGILCTVVINSPSVAGSLEEIKRTHTFEICVQSDDLPFSNETGSPRGVLLELGDSVAQKLGVELKVKWIFSAEYVRKTTCDAIPVVAAIPGDDPLRLTDPYISIRTVVVVSSAHPPIRNLDDLRHDRVAVLAESWARHLLNQEGITLRVRFLTNEAALDAVVANDADAAVVTLLSYDWYKHQHPGIALRAEEGFVLDPDLDYVASFGLRHSDQQAAAKVGEVLQGLISDGTLAQIFASYGLRYERPAHVTPTAN
jgi:polar amino acid transport system substrate-binding protein